MIGNLYLLSDNKSLSCSVHYYGKNVFYYELDTNSDVLKYFLSSNFYLNWQKLAKTKQLKKASTKCLQRANTFTNRLVNEWNALPGTVIDADSVNKFKNRYDSFMSSQQL
ncbi:hypothetical protein BpHYR1_020836 [Brachionus plicatilis]|uniref:RNA-directed DNA polymerase from mobile element jockey-like n=1 Tax=Brachionus plicatilis TaxID=10195 RepID=A0A3M7RN99_BRAPC|nr:hypothetical protein BpHYR1_020836 [Brachionus plicatilis]